MPIYVRCEYCKTNQNAKNKVCKKCKEPLKHKKYIVRVNYSGTIITKTVTGTLNLAREIEAKIKSELVSGEYYDRRQAKKENIKYSNFIKEKYLPYARIKKSYDKEVILINRWIIPTLGDKELSKLSPFDIEKVKKVMLTNNKSPRTVQYVLSIIRHSLNKAIDWGMLSGINPATRVKAPKVNNKRTRFLTIDEANALLQEVKIRSKQTYEICLLSLYTGMRAGEVFNVKFGDLDFANGIIHIRDPKNNEDRVAYMTEEVADMLSAKQGEPNEYVFKNTKGNKINAISKAYFRAVDKLGFNKGITDKRDKVVFHTLRHTFASWLAMNGTPIYTIQRLMGHKTLAMTERYSHLAPNTQREAVRGLEAMLKRGNVISAEFGKQ